MRFLTAGESHGKALVAILDGLPSGVKICEDAIAWQLERRRKFYGRSSRMTIERDGLEMLSGVHNGVSIGSPISFIIRNKDYRQEIFDEPITSPRAGHADLAGMIKYGHFDARLVAERASGRETATRTAVGAILRQMLGVLGIEINSHTTQIGNIRSSISYYNHPAFDSANQPVLNNQPVLDTVNHPVFDSANQSVLDTVNHPVLGGANQSLFDSAIADESPVRCLDGVAEKDMILLIDEALDKGESLGGEVEIIASGMPIGFGSYVQFDRRLDHEISAIMMSIPSVKSVTIGNRETNRQFGSGSSDAIGIRDGKPIRASNNAGGIEGGISNGEDIVLTLSIKPIPSVKKGIDSVDVTTGKAKKSHFERSDICVVPAISVIAENLLSIALSKVILSELGGDTMAELNERFNSKKNKKLPFFQ